VLKPRQRNIFFTAIELHPVALVQYTFTEKLSILIIEVSFFPTKMLKPRQRNIFVTAIVLTPCGSSTVHIYIQTIHITTQLIWKECGPWWVVAFRRVCSELLSKGRHWVVTWRTTGQEWVPGVGDSRGVACLGVVTLSK